MHVNVRREDQILHEQQSLARLRQTIGRRVQPGIHSMSCGALPTTPVRRPRDGVDIGISDEQISAISPTRSPWGTWRPTTSNEARLPSWQQNHAGALSPDGFHSRLQRQEAPLVAGWPKPSLTTTLPFVDAQGLCLTSGTSRTRHVQHRNRLEHANLVAQCAESPAYMADAQRHGMRDVTANEPSPWARRGLRAARRSEAEKAIVIGIENREMRDEWRQFGRHQAIINRRVDYLRSLGSNELIF